MGVRGATIEIEQLGCSFGSKRVLEDLNLLIPAGELIAIVGPSGCGKSTLLRLIAGLQVPTCGRLAVDGAEISGRQAHRWGVGFVFQDLSLYPHFTVRKNLQFSLRSQKLGNAELDGAVVDTARVLGIDDLLERYPADLSGGEKQRVAIGRAIIRKPSLLLLDEPLSQLDAHLRSRLRNELFEVQRRIGATTLYVTHDCSEALAVADRILLMREGRIVQDDSPEQIYLKPANLWVAEFFGYPAMNILPAAIIQQQLVIEGTAMGPAGLDGRFEGQVQIGIRPSDITVASGDGGEYNFVAKVRRIYRRDDRFGVILETSLGLCEAIFSGDRLPKVDSTVTIGVAHKSMLFFDAETGHRIG